MALLTREEVQEIRDRARGARACGECETLADDVDRLLADLAEGPPRIFIAAAGAPAKERLFELRRLAAKHRCAVHVLPHGWIESNAEQRETFERALRHVTKAAREECAKIVERGTWPDGLPPLLAVVAADIRALNEVSP